MNPADPLCFDCNGTVEVIERDERFLTAYCPTCDNWFGAEVETSSDGRISYWPMFRVIPSGGTNS